MTNINSNKGTPATHMVSRLLHVFRSMPNAALIGTLVFAAIQSNAVRAADLTVSDGVVVKFGSDAQLVVRDKLAAGKGVAFTSQKDDSIAGQANASAQTPAAGDWRGIRIEKSSSAYGVQIGDSAVIRYAGASDGAGLTLRGVKPALNYLQLTGNAVGLRLQSAASPQISGSSVMLNGVGIEASDDSAPVITGSQFSRNTAKAMLNNTPATVIQATGNWWGHASGPNDPIGNAQGQGDAVSAGVNYGQFLAQAPLMNPSIQLASPAAYVEQSTVAVRIACLNATEYRIAENGAFAGVAFQPLSGEQALVNVPLSSGDGLKPLTVQFRNAAGTVASATLSGGVLIDTQPPQLAVTNPADGSLITKSITISATATDTAGVAKVEFWIDGALAATVNDTPYHYDWAASNLQNGSHQIKVVAYDNVGRKAEDVRSITFQKLVSAYTMQVNGLANIYGAGHGTAPNPGGGGAGVLPPSQSFAAGAGQVLTFTDVAGQVSCCTGSSSYNGPDGGPYATGSTNISAYGGLSGMKHLGKSMFLAGVFLDDSEPAGPAPDTLDFSSNTGFASLAPQIRQVFFIGDGLTATGTGDVQKFNIPPTATRLFLGFADGYDFKGLPGYYGDNQGLLTASFNITRPLDADVAGPTVAGIKFGAEAIGNGGTITGTGVVTAGVVDPSGVSRAELLFDDVLVGAMANASGTYSATLNLDAIGNGNHALSIRAADSLNNVSVTSINVTVAHAAPNPPALNQQLNGTTTRYKEQIITGQAPANSQVQLYVNSVPAGSAIAAGSNGGFSAPVTLAPGNNLIQATAANQYGTSALSAGVTINLDLSVPTAPSNPVGASQAGGKIRLTWVRSTDPNATSTTIYRGTGPFDTAGAAIKAATVSAATTAYDDLPAQDGVYYYRLASVNSLGTPSELTSQVQAVSDSKAPRASIAYTPLGKVDSATGRIGQGKVNVAMTVTEALQSLPYFAVVPNGGAPITVDLVKQDDTHYNGSFTIDAATGSGTANVLFSARDAIGNRGTDIDAGATLKIDTEGPAVTGIAITPAAPIKNDTARTITATFTLSKAMKPGETPQLTYLLSGPVRGPAALTGITQVNAITWRGNFALPPDAGAGTPETFSFAFRGIDDLDNVSTKIATADNRFQVYQGNLPPFATPLGLKAEAKPGGKVRLTWQAVDQASAYQLYRQGPGDTGLAAAQRVSGAEYIDTTTQDGKYQYAVASVRQSNGEESLSSQSAPVEVMASATAPGAPQNLALKLASTGIQAAWQPPLNSTVATYNLYRSSASSISTIEGLAPVKTGIKQAGTVDANPSPTDHAYVVTALDAAGNESAISNSVYLNFNLLPVATLKVEQIGNDLPQLSWTPTRSANAGYNVYIGPDAGKVKLTAAPTASLTFQDSGYTSGERRYTVAAVDSNGVEQPRTITLPNAGAQIVSGMPIKRGVMNKLQVQVTNTSTDGFDNAQVVVRVNNIDHKSAVFALAANETRMVPVIVGGYADLQANAPMQVGLEIVPNEGEFVKAARNTTADVSDGALVVGMATEEFTRGGTGKVRLTIENTTDVDVELLTARNNGTLDSDELRFKIQDNDGNVLAVQPYKQVFGASVITIGSGQTVARIPAGASYTSDLFNLNVPQGAPDKIRVKLEVDKLHYHTGQPDEVAIKGNGSEKEVVLTDTAYTGEVTGVSPISSYGDQDIVITGRAIDRNTSAPLPNSKLKLVLNQQGFERIINVLTDAAGSFIYAFKPTLTDSGLYKVSAVHPDITDRPEQRAFTINRVTVGPSPVNLNVPRNYNYAIPLQATSGLGTAATNLRLALDPAAQPTGALPAGVTLQLPNPVNIGSRQTLNIPVRFTADNTAQPSGRLVVSAFSDEHANSPIGLVTVNYTLSEAKPYLTSSPSYVETGLAQGGSRVESVVFENKGLQEALDVQLSLTNKDGGAAPAWVSLATGATLGTIAVGEKKSADISFAPSSSVAEGVYEFKLNVQGTNVPAQSMSVFASVSQSGQGSVLFKAADIYTATIDKSGKFIPGLAGATVTIQNEDVVTLGYSLTTDSLGEALFQNIPAGRYKFRAKATNHQELGGRFEIKPGITANEPIFLDYNLVQVEWSVREVTLQDRYDITLNATFETDVPAPVVVLSPSSTNLPLLKAGEVFQGELTLTNYGLVRADNVRSQLPQSDANFRYEFLTEPPKTLEAKQKVTLPYRIIALVPLDAAAGTASGGGCWSYSQQYVVPYEYTCANGTQSQGSTRTYWFSYANNTCAGAGTGGGSSISAPGIGGGGIGGASPGYSTLEGLDGCNKSSDDCHKKKTGGGGTGAGGTN